jgi:hypothetical protein
MRRQQTGRLEFRISVHDANATDSERIGQIAAGRQAVAGPQNAVRDLLANGTDQLPVDRLFRALIDLNRRCYSFHNAPSFGT